MDCVAAASHASMGSRHRCDEAAATSACSASARSAAARGTCSRATRRRSRAAPGGRSASPGSPTRTLERARDGDARRAAASTSTDDLAAGRRRIRDIDIVVELIGGIEPARDAGAARRSRTASTSSPPTRRCWRTHGNEIFAAAHAKGVMVAFEAAVAGGIPIIKALREGLTANRIEWIAGIINGTATSSCRKCARRGASFADVLAEAQARGYAEADPTFDIEGIDAAHKLTIMSAIAFGVPMQFDKAYTEGISQADARGHPLRRGAGLPDQAARHHAARTATARRHRAARASDADPDEAPDRQRRRRDERGAGQGRRGRRRRCTTAPARAPSRRRARSSPTWSTSRACTPPIPSIACRISRSSPTS